jgi:hypothetical protein
MQPELIQNKIYEIRGQKVMLDFDLAELYEVETRRLNEQVKRNISRFPKDFMFQLSKEEWGKIQLSLTISNKENQNWSQFATSSKKHRGAAYAPYAFTEHGVTMLASVLRSEKAVQVNIAIVRAFVALRNLSMHYKDIAQKLAELEEKYDMQFLDIYGALNKLIEEKTKTKSWEKRERIGFLKQKK